MSPWNRGFPGTHPPEEPLLGSCGSAAGAKGRASGPKALGLGAGGPSGSRAKGAALCDLGSEAPQTGNGLPGRVLGQG